MSRARGGAAARALKTRIDSAKRHATIWREEATTITGGWRVKTTTYDDLDDAPEESEEVWSYVDSLDEPQVSDEIAFVRMGDRPIVIGKIARAVSTLARISRNIRFTGNYGLEYYGTTPVATLGAGAGTGGSLGISNTGTDHTGRVTVTTGSAGFGVGILARVTFAGSIAGPYTVKVWGVDTDAVRVGVYSDFGTRDAAYFEISCQTAPIANTSHQIEYEVVQYES